MDTSKEYIEMCRDAKQIQESWKPEAGDWIHRAFTIFGEEIDRSIWGDKTSEINQIVWNSKCAGYSHCTNSSGESRTYKHPADMVKETCIWLPRQDQLQEMVLNEFLKTRRFLAFGQNVAFDKPMPCMLVYLPNGETEQFHQGRSIEQLWLAFVMKEKFNKEWDGIAWVSVRTDNKAIERDS